MDSRLFSHLLVVALLLVLSVSQVVPATTQFPSANGGPAPNPFCSATDTTGFFCSNCYGGYYLNMFKICVLGNSLCASYNMTGGACLSCYGGYYLNGGNCLLPNPYCKTYNSTTGWCTSCNPGYTI